MKYKRGDIAWVKFPFSDASSNKFRPALVISNNLVNQTSDYLLMQITTRLRSDALSFIIPANAYKESPLLKQSELRLHKIFIINESLIESKITSVKANFMEAAVEKLFLLLK
jgi:mRNA interferase MazF